MSWLRSAPPSLAGSAHGLTGVGVPASDPPPWPESAKVKLAPSPPLMYSAPSGPNATVPIEWLGYCWHQSLIRTCSGPVLTSPLTGSRDSRALTRHPSVVGPGGVGQASPQRGAVAPIAASYV